MLRAYIFYRLVKNTLLTAFILSLILLTLQLTRLSNVLFGIPFKDFMGFLVVWNAYYTYFFIPEGVILSTFFLMKHFKDKKLLHVFYSFRISDFRIFLYCSIPFLTFFLISALLSNTLLEEKVAFTRKNMLFKLQEKFFSEVPAGTFVSFGAVVLHAEKREGNTLKEAFFKFGDITVLSEYLKYKGNGVFEFRRGTVITEEENYFVVKFNEYTLNLKQFQKKKLREKRLKESKVVNYVNVATLPLFFFLSFTVALKFCHGGLSYYAFASLFIVVHQLIIFVVKLML
ncbi:LptF/LptG family permease [Aquifex aeolicus]|uniref:Uncharacterized protein aq_539 n=1 Tax=Aquifex aeolicus (strain VF5) TaxID=224324 RepID=Y539_AQUAE|nr:LptF/LptG family permease [Aquifex aeolicus]O66818.1 RecName: Full=Uncharacterized protein aq_539 [Aquifex aeolicus VF5]AAC06778.1 putative protein [Aquifex aeolicus VF5]